MIFYEPASRDRTLLRHDPFKALVAPRPIGWISTRHPDGATNLAPYSFFNAVGDTPPLLAFSSNGYKDSVAFAAASREFTWNLATYDLRDAMNATSATLPRGVSEFAHAGLAMAPGRLVGSPRVAASPCALECRVTQILQLHDMDGAPIDQHLCIGQVVGVHLDERFISGGLVDIVAMRPIQRCGYLGDYAVLTGLFQMQRPR